MPDRDGAVQASNPSPVWYVPRDTAAFGAGLAWRRGAGTAPPDASFAPSRIRRTTRGRSLQVAVTATPAAGTSTRSSLDAPARGSSAGRALRRGARTLGPDGALGAEPRGSTRIASLRPTACTGQRCSAPGEPRYTAWRSKRTQVAGLSARS